MSPITLVSVFRKAEFLKSRNVLLELYSKSRKKTINILLFISVLVSALAVATNIYNLKWSLPLFLLAGLLLLINTFLFLEKTRQKKQYIEQTSHVSETYTENDFFIKYEISNDAIKLSDNNKSINLRWKYFAGYTVYITYLILIPKLGSYLDGIVFENNSPNFTSIEEIVSSNLTKISAPK